ncbi:MAG: hypothetical protein IJ305_00585 [Oscillospiraceae bacterium]|nr:hypothetical protein [Oscillospiraceae bacterium]
MSYTKKLFKLKKPFDTEQSNELFLNAVKENCEFHYRNCPEYKQILDGADFSPEDLKEYKDI